MSNCAWVGLGGWLLLSACTAGKDEALDSGDADTDVDADSDTDSDADSDAPDADGDSFSADVDCDDANADIYPGAPDLCGDELVTDCDRTSDDGLVTLDGTQGFDDLADALGVAQAGSEILICPGTHEGQFVATVPLRLVAYTDATTTILSGSNAGSVLVVPGDTEIVGLTIRDGNGGGAGGGGIRMVSPGTLLLQDCVIDENRAVTGAGIVVAPNSTATLVNTVVSGNLATQNAGGVYVSAGSTLDLSAGSSVTGNGATYAAGGVELVDATLLGGIVSDNTLIDYGSVSYTSSTIYYDGPFAGAGIAAIGLSRIEDTEVMGNMAPAGSGISNTAGDLTLVDVSIHDNSTALAYGVGGGIAAVGGTVRMEGSTEVYANTAAQGAGMVGIDALMIGGIIRDNAASDFGGGVAFTGGVLQGTTITGNSAPFGGGVFVVSQGTTEDVVVTGNTADLGGGFGTDDDYGDNGSLLVINGGSVTGNNAIDGGGLHAAWRTQVNGTIFTDNTAEIGGALSVGERIDLTNTVLLRNEASQGGGVWLATDARLFATEVDFGVDVDDNTPDDIYFDQSYGDFGANTSLACDENGCAP